MDTDGDGLNDWEEYQLGLDPFNAYSNGQLDGNGQPLSDYDYVTDLRLARPRERRHDQRDRPHRRQPEPGQLATQTGTFTITRGREVPRLALTVNLVVGGPGIGYGNRRRGLLRSCPGR